MCKEPLKLNNHKCLLLKVNQRPRHCSKKANEKMLPCQEESECRLKQWDTTTHIPEWPKSRRENTKCWLGCRATRALIYWWGSAEWRRFIGEQIGLRWFVLSNSNRLRMDAYARTYMQILRAAQKSPVRLLVSEWLQEQMMRDGPIQYIYIWINQAMRRHSVAWY